MFGRDVTSSSLCVDVVILNGCQDYYSNTVFEFVQQTSDAPDKERTTHGGITVLAGGCYDGLVESLGGHATVCVGWAAGVDRLSLLREMPTKTLFSVAVRLTLSLRNRNLTHFVLSFFGYSGRPHSCR